MKIENISMLKQTTIQLDMITKDIEFKTKEYTSYKVMAIIFVIFSFLYGSRILSKQILTNSKNIQNSRQEAEELAVKANFANQAKSDFLANMSHEIRTPLNAILGFIDILKEKESDPERLKYFQTVQNSSKSLLGIINDILDFSKIESGNLHVEKIDFNTYNEFNTIADLFRAKASEENVSLTVNIDPNMPSALISDPLRIKQVMANLLSNAIKFADRNGTVIFNIEYKNGFLNVSVRDNGIGIAKDKQESIFKAFSQAESSTTRKYGGTGLGLAISSKLISMLGGELKVESKLGEGSNFYFSIAVEIGKYKNDNSKITTDNQSLKGKHILVVEDNKANQMFMSLILKKFGITFDIANNGVEAIDAYKKSSYDLIFMDENMPILNGIEATQTILMIEKHNNLKHTPIIALTANALKGDRERFIQAGLDEYLTKPINKEKLFEMMIQFISTSKEKIVVVS
jgi:signal transduction histidine kinase/CheY-like chemotaxis protein